MPALNPATAGTEALAEFDANGDGLLSKTELEKSPALQSAAERIDKNQDGALSKEEISARVQWYLDAGTSLFAWQCEVIWNGQPLSGAAVTLIPEKFLGSSLKPATGVTDESGIARPMIDDETMAGVQCGLFRVEISKKDARGQEVLPTKYNTRTILGQEFAPDVETAEHGNQFVLTK